MQTFTDVPPHRHNGGAPCDIADLPRGIVLPPPEVVATVAAERAKFPPEVYDDDYAKQTLDDWTLSWHYSGLDIASRSVPQGVEVLAAGIDEVGEYLKGKSEKVLLTFTTYQPC